MRLDVVFSLPAGASYVPSNSRHNRVTSGGIATINLKNAQTTSVAIEFYGSCCSRPNCRFCVQNPSHPDCVPTNPQTRAANYYCCCMGIDTFPLAKRELCADRYSAMASPEEGGARADYLLSRSVGWTTTDQYHCDSSHVRRAVRYSAGLVENWQDKSLQEVLAHGGVPLSSLTGVAINTRVLDMDGVRCTFPPARCGPASGCCVRSVSLKRVLGVRCVSRAG